MKVENMKGKNGREIPNQFIIFTPEATYFQSYKSIIVKTTFENGKRVVYLGNDWQYSRTTAKYRNQFLGETTKEIEAKIKQGVYTVVNLDNETIGAC